MWTLLSTVDDVFQIRGRGCVIAPGIPRSVEWRIQIGAAVRLIRPDGSNVETVINGIEMGGPLDSPGIPVLLGAEVSKNQIPLGSQLWVQSPQ